VQRQLLYHGFTRKKTRLLPDKAKPKIGENFNSARARTRSSPKKLFLQYPPVVASSFPRKSASKPL
jgi:hypothetical protein